MNTAAFKQALRQNRTLFWVSLIFVALTFRVALTSFPVLTPYNSIPSDFPWVGFLLRSLQGIVGGGGFVCGAFCLSKAALSFSKEAAKCQQVALEISHWWKF